MMDGPTPADLKARFPGFAAVADAVVQTALDEAALQVGADWTSAPDARLGRLLLAAHILTLDGQGSGAEAAAAAAGGYRRMRSGALELERPDTAGAEPGTLGSTGYGRRFLELMQRNVPAVTVV
jgi:hypothetical protein